MTSKRIPINGRPAAAEDPSAAAGDPGSGPASAGPAPGAAGQAGGLDPAPGVTTPRGAGGATAAPEATTRGDTARPEQARLEAEVEGLRRERDVLADRELRFRAEFENFRKRAAREAIEARERAQGQLWSELLPVLDNLERALDAAEHHDERKVLGGVRMTRDMFVDLLRRSGVEEIETVGAPFDPHIHEAVVMQPSDQKEGIITAVLERGYRQGERVLRPARVAVSSGPAEVAGGRE